MISYTQDKEQRVFLPDAEVVRKIGVEGLLDLTAKVTTATLARISDILTHHEESPDPTTLLDVVNGIKEAMIAGEALLSTWNPMIINALNDRLMAGELWLSDIEYAREAL